MATATLSEHYLQQLEALNSKIQQLNNEKIQLLLEVVGIEPDKDTLQQLLRWGLILVTVPDRGLTISLNKYCTYVPNLKFVFDKEQPPFTLIEGVKGRRIWKERE